MDRLIESTVLLDFKGLVLRSFYRHDSQIAKAVDDFLTTTIQPTLDHTPARRIIACLDDTSSFRSTIFPEYKASRAAQKRDKDAEENMLVAAKEALLNLGVQVALAPGAEADDLIAYFAEKLPGSKWVLSIDGDMAALAARHDTYVTIGNDVIDKEYKGVPCNVLTIHKALVGDNSDNYGGVPGIGPAKVLKMAEAYGWDGLEELEAWVVTNDPSILIKAAADTQDTTLQTIADNWDKLRMDYGLARLRPEDCEVTTLGSFNAITWERRIPDATLFDKEQVVSGATLFSAAFRPGVFRTDVLVTNDNLQTVWGEIFDLIGKGTFVAIDYESYDTLKHEPYQKAAKGKYVDMKSQKITGMSIACGPDMTTTYYFSTDHKDTENVDISVVDTLLRWLKDSNVKIVAHNGTFETVLTFNGMNMDFDLGEIIDTAVTARYVDENLQNNLKSLTKDYFGYHQTTYAEVTQGRDMNELSGLEVLSYGCDDAICSAFLLNAHNTVMQLEGTDEFCMANEFKFTRVMVDSYFDGDKIDWEELDRQSDAADKTIKFGVEIIDETLKTHCVNPSQERAAPLFYKLWEYADSTADYDNDMQRDDARALLWNEVYASSGYVTSAKPKGKKPIKFAATATFLNKALEAAGIETKLESISNKAIVKWAAEANEKYNLSVLGVSFSDTSSPESLIQAITEASGKIRNKDAPARKHLEEVCMAILNKEQEVQEAPMAGTINLRSSPQMQRMLYAKVGVPIRNYVQVKPGSKRFAMDMEGAPATDEHAIRVAIAEDTVDGSWENKVLLQTLDVIKARTKKSNYYDAYRLWKSPIDGRVHGSIRNCGTVSLRPSGSQPNRLQIEKPGVGDFRKVFLPFDKDHVIIAIDFAGQELRILGSESKDEKFLSAYLGSPEKDIHSVTAVSLLIPLFEHMKLEDRGLTLEQATSVTYEEFEKLRARPGILASALKTIRNVFAKALNFIVIYGGGPSKLAAKLMITETLARTLIDAWNTKYYGVSEWKQKVIEEARRTGYSQTAYGHRRHLGGELFKEEGWRRGRAERQMINNIIQGCAAGILKRVFADAYDSNLFERYSVQQVLPIYDEVRASVPKVCAADYTLEMIKMMEVTPPGQQIPMVAEASVCIPSWFDKVEVGRVNLEDPDDVARFRRELEACWAEKEPAESNSLVQEATP